MKAYYARVSSLDQKTDRQLVDTSGMVVFEDKCSGSVPFSERDAGKQVLQALEDGELDGLTVLSLDRLGRSLIDILQTIERFNEHSVPIEIKKEGLRTLDEDGNPNPTATMVISILGVMAELERSLIRDRQAQGIAIAKARGDVYLGRKHGTVETRNTFLAKSRTKKIIAYLQKGYKGVEIQKLLGCSPNTISKVRRLVGDPLNQCRAAT